MSGVIAAAAGTAMIVAAVLTGRMLKVWGAGGRAARWAAGTTGAGMILMASMVVVPKGQVAVIDVFGNVMEEYALEEGLHLKAPWWTPNMKLVQVLMAEHVGENHIVALSGNSLEIQMDIVMFARLRAEHAWCIVQRLEDGRWMKQLEALMRTTVRDAATKHEAEPLVTKQRGAFQEEIENRTRADFGDLLEGAQCSPEAVVIQEVGVRKMRLPKIVRDAVAERTVAQQAVERMKHVIERERKEATRKEIEAGGIQRFQEIVSEGIDENLLRWKGIEATREIASSEHTSKVVVIGGGPSGMPLVNPAQGAQGAGAPAMILNLGDDERPRTSGLTPR